MENNGPVTYCAMKAAVIAYTHSLGRVLAKTGIVVSTVLPGAVYTEGGFWDQAMAERPDHVEKYLADRCPAGRFGTVEDIGYMVAFLASELADFCQGAVVPVDGGQSRHYFVK
jgi:3-oxoacyl-[acyl-carrier protein] reductase